MLVASIVVVGAGIGGLAVALCAGRAGHDGVLVDSLGFHRDAWLELGRRTGQPMTEEFVLDTFGITNPMIFRRLVGDALDDAEVARLGDLKEECYRDVARGKIVLMDGVASISEGGEGGKQQCNGDYG